MLVPGTRNELPVEYLVLQQISRDWIRLNGIVRKSRGSFRPRDFRSVIVRKSRDYLSTKLVLKMTTTLRRHVDVAITPWQRDHTTMRMISHDNDDEAMMQTHNNHDATTRRWCDHMTQHIHDTTNDSTMQRSYTTIRPGQYTTHRNDTRGCDDLQHHGTWHDHKMSRRQDATMQRYNDTTCCKNLCWC